MWLVTMVTMSTLMWLDLRTFWLMASSVKSVAGCGYCFTSLKGWRVKGGGSSGTG